MQKNHQKKSFQNYYQNLNLNKIRVLSLILKTLFYINHKNNTIINIQIAETINSHFVPVFILDNLNLFFEKGNNNGIPETVKASNNK